MTITSVCGGLKTLRKDHRDIDNNSAFAICAIILLVLVRWTITMGGSKSNFIFSSSASSPSWSTLQSTWFVSVMLFWKLSQNEQTIAAKLRKENWTKTCAVLRKDWFLFHGKTSERSLLLLLHCLYTFFLQTQTFNSNFPNFKKLFLIFDEPRNLV